MRVAYADPPYLGQGAKIYKSYHPEAEKWDNPEYHSALIQSLCIEYDAWAMSLSSPSLRVILPMCPDDCRIMAWVKPFCSFKPGVGVAYAWEPVIVWQGRLRTREQDTVRDWHSANITMQQGLPGAKPKSFALWLFEVLNLEPSDEFCDLFPGTGAVGDAWNEYRFRLI